MLLECSRIFATRKERNRIYERIIFTYRLCGTLEELEVTKEEFERELGLIKQDDELNKDNWHIPILPEIEEIFEEQRMLITTRG